MVYQDLSLCDTIDVAGNLFLGREPRRASFGLPLLDKTRMREEARAHLDALEIHIPNLAALVASSPAASASRSRSAGPPPSSRAS